MKMKSYSIFTAGLAVCVTFLAASRTHGAAIHPLFRSRKALTGIKKFELELVAPNFVEDLPEDFPKERLDEVIPNWEHFPNDPDLEKRIKSACGAYGIEVLTRGDPNRWEADAYLHVRITDIYPFLWVPGPGTSPPAYIYTVTTYVVDNVSATGDTKMVFSAIIWARTLTKISDASDFVWDIKDLLNEQLDDFIKDYLIANRQTAKSNKLIPEHKGGNLVENIKPVTRRLLAGVTCTLLLFGLGAMILRRQRKTGVTK